MDISGKDIKNVFFLISYTVLVIPNKSDYLIHKVFPAKFTEMNMNVKNDMKKFLLEFGRDFIFMGKEYYLQVGKNIIILAKSFL